MEPFKNIYNKKSITSIAQEIQKQEPSFEAQLFIKSCTTGLNSLEMKERIVHISQQIEKYLPGPYNKNLKILMKTLKSDQNDEGLSGFSLWPYSYYIEEYGLSSFKSSMKALYEITKRFTSEFGIRPYLEKYPDEVYILLNQWCSDKNEHVRRLVSEGTRPNLPWGKKVSHLNQNLKKNIQLLEQLKDDESEYVRKSVANHMNDISWIDSSLTIKTLKKWSKSKDENIQWIIKRALRSLLKQGHPPALELLGFSTKLESQIKKLKLSKSIIKEGDSFMLEFELKNNSSKKHKIMVDYIIHYPKANGTLSAKTFKLKVLELDPKESRIISKKINFKKVTTRKHYKGLHILEIQVNGLVKEKSKFSLI